MRTMLSAVLFVGATVAQSQLPTLGLPAMPWLEQRQGHQCMACFAAGTDPAYVQLMQTVYGGTSLAAGLEDYRTLDRWAAPTGSGRVLTYSFPPDGLAISGHGGNVLRQLSLAKWGNEQAWKDWFRGVFDSWQAVTDLRFVEVLDDGAAWGTLGSGFVRGDIRLGAGTIDGMGNTLALARLPSGGGDIVIDRVDMPGMDLTCFASLVAHEIGHTLGLVHVCPLDSSKLMEPMLNCLSGPSVDDIRGGQDLYGDRFEPNETASAAVSLTSRGARPGVTLRLFNLGLRTDSDQDWFSLELCPQDQVTVTVMPIGSNYPEGPQTQQGCTATGTVQASSLLDLALEFAPPGGFPSLINANGLGGNETHNVSGAGRINFRVFAWTSRSQRNQLYDLIVDIQPRPSSSVLYVNAAATGSGNGTSWQNAFRGVNQALAAATGGCGGASEIWVAAGTYRPAGGFVGNTPPDLTISFVVPDGVRVFGGFAGTETELAQRDPVANRTILSGSYPHPIFSGVRARNVVKMTNVGNGTLLDGLTITSGAAASTSPSGGGILLNNSSPIIRNCTVFGTAVSNGGAVASLGNGRPTFEGCMLSGGDGTSATAFGGALYLANGGVLSRCTIQGSIAVYGGGIALGAGELLVEDCTLTDNNAWNSGLAGGTGGAIRAHLSAAGTLRVRNSVFTDNQAVNGGGIYASGQAVVDLENCRFERNAASQSGGALFADGSSCRLAGLAVLDNRASVGGGASIATAATAIVACTFTRNDASSSAGGLLVSGVGAVRNSILWGNTVGMASGGQLAQLLPGGGLFGPTAIGNCCVQGWTGSLGGTGNLGQDPQLVDPAAGDVHILRTSPCLDAGLSSATGQPAADLDGQPRRLCREVDIGVDEFGESLVQYFGTSCVGELTLLGVPRVGEEYHVQGWAPGGAGFLYGGLSNTNWPGVGLLPLDLGVLGATGCFIYASPDLQIYGGPVSNAAVAPTTIPFGVPNNPAFVCIRLFHQWVFWDGLSPLSNLRTSRAAEVVLGF